MKEMSRLVLVLSSLLLLAVQCDGGKFWHISDLHLDYLYTSGGELSNWCHSAASDSDPPASINTDIVGPAGNYHCDAPNDLVESALLAMVRFAPKPDFIVWTGDSAPHWKDPVPPSEDYILNVTKTVFTRLDKLFPNIPIVPALGNHDASPPDQFPQYDPANKTSPEYYRKLWQNGAFGDHIATDAMETFQKCGFYSKVVSPSDKSIKLKFIVLNTNIYYNDNSTRGPDPCGQLDWLNNTLHTSNPKQEKVFIVAHVSPGSYERQPGRINFDTPPEHFVDIHKRYVQIVTDPTNAAKISAHLYGHLHTDTFRVLLDRATKKEAVGVAFIAGSVTPVVWANNVVVGTNPTIRLMEYDDNTAVVTDYKQYSLDIIKAANKDTTIVTEVNKDAEKAITEDASESPRSRRKNAKFLKKADEPDINKPPSKRESLEDSPDDTSYTLQTSSSTTAAPSKIPGATSFPVIPAVPVTTEKVKQNQTSSTERPKGDGDVVAKNKNDTVAAVDGSGSDNETTLSSIINDDSTNTSSTDAINNATEVTSTALVNTTSPTSTNSPASDLNKTETDYPTYLSTQWYLLYTATTYFSVPDLSPTSMFTALKMMVSGGANSSIFESYYEHNTGGHIVDKCNNTCWRQQLCTITNLIEKELMDCLSNSGKNGFFEATKTATTKPDIPTQRTGAMFGEGGDDPDLAVHADTDHSHDHDGDGEDDHKHEDHAKSDADHQDDLYHDHDGDGEADHDHKDHAEHFPVPNGKESVTKQKLEDTSSDLTSRAVAIFFGVFALAIVALAAGMGYKKYRDNRYRNQEFLLTDAVFRYDGYSQLDDA